MPRNSEGLPASLIAAHGHVVGAATPLQPDARMTEGERLAWRALVEVRNALGMSVHDTPQALAEAVRELVQRKGPSSLHAVHVDIGGTEYAVAHQVAAELARLRDGMRGAVVLVQVALDLRDEAVDLLSEAVETTARMDTLDGGFVQRANLVRREREDQRASVAVGEG